MKTNRLLVNTLLTAVVGAACLALLLCHVFIPDLVLPDLNLTVVVALSLLALVAEQYLAPNRPRCWLANILLGALTLGLLPFCAGLATPEQAVELFLLGGGTFAVCLFLYTSMALRLASGPVARLAPVVTALGLFLASQCFMGILF